MTLPKGWEEARLGAVLDVVSGFAFKSTEYQDSGHFLIRIGNVQDGEINLNNPKFVSLSDSTRRFELFEGDVLTSLTGNIGRVARIERAHLPSALNQRVAKLQPIASLSDDGYLYRFLRSAAFRDALSSQGQGAAQQNVSPKVIEDIIVPLPPAAEQRRIVAKLDALTARLAHARVELDRVPVLAERLRISVLRNVFGRSDGELPHGWEMKRIDEIGEVQLGRQRSPKDHDGPNMRPYVRSANITWKGWDLTDVKEMNFAPSEFETFQLLPGDVVLNEGSGSAKEVGKPAIWNGEIEGVCFQNTLLRVRPHAYSAELLRYAMLYLARSGQFIANTKGVNIIHIGKAGLAKTKLPVPPQGEQQSILAKFDTAFARADRLEAEAARARALLDRLEAAILAKAFRGELLPQDPNDEPASVLLDRIRAERASALKPKRGRRAAAEA